MSGDRSVAVCVIGMYGYMDLLTYLTANGPELIATQIVTDCTLTPDRGKDFLVECDPANQELASAIEHELQKIKDGYAMVCEEPT